MSAAVYENRNALPAKVAAINEAQANVAEYRGTVQLRLVVELLDLLDAETLEGLRTIEPERLAHEQGRLAAFGQLRDLLRKPT